MYRHVMVATPTIDGRVPVDWVPEMMLLQYLLGERGIRCGFLRVSGISLITLARNILVDSFLNSPGTDLFFLDADINFHAQDMVRVIEHSTDRDIVGALYPLKTDPIAFPAMPASERDDEVIMSEGLIEFNRIPTGFMNIRRRVFEAIIVPKVNFKDGTKKGVYFDFLRDGDDYIGEDFFFCDLARDHGFKIHIDPTIQLGHIGDKEYVGRFIDYMMDQDAVKDKEASTNHEGGVQGPEVPEES